MCQEVTAFGNVKYCVPFLKNTLITEDNRDELFPVILQFVRQQLLL